MESEILELIIVGTGSYVCGSGDNDFGTILPAILNYSKKFNVNLKIIVACNTSLGGRRITKKFSKLKELINIKNNVNINLINCDGEPENFFKNYEIKSSKLASIVAIPDQHHFKWIKSLITQKVPILAVKPLTLNLQDSIELTNLARQLKVPAFVEFHKRYDKQLRYARDVFNSNELGNLLYSYTEYTQKKSIPEKTFKKWSDKTNIFSYLGVHYVDAIYYLTKAKPKRVMATGQKSFLKAKGIDTFDSIQCNILWELRNKFEFNQTIMCSWVESNYASAMSSQNINLIFSQGRINCEQKNRGLTILKDRNGVEHINPDFSRAYSEEDYITFEGYGIDAYTNFIHFILDNKLFIKDERLCNFSEACISTSVIDAAFNSLKQKSSWIEIN